MIACSDAGETSNGAAESVDDAASQIDDNRIVVGRADDLNLDASAFPDDWSFKSSGSSTGMDSGFRAMKRNGISLTDIIDVRVDLYLDVEEARFEFSKATGERANKLKNIDLGNEAFVYETINGNKIYFRYLNIVAQVHSLASTGLSGSERKAKEWAERLLENIQFKANYEPINTGSAASDITVNGTRYGETIAFGANDAPDDFTLIDATIDSIEDKANTMSPTDAALKWLQNLGYQEHYWEIYDHRFVVSRITQGITVFDDSDGAREFFDFEIGFEEQINGSSERNLSFEWIDGPDLGDRTIWYRTRAVSNLDENQVTFVIVTKFVIGDVIAFLSWNKWNGFPSISDLESLARVVISNSNQP